MRLISGSVANSDAEEVVEKEEETFDHQEQCLLY